MRMPIEILTGETQDISIKQLETLEKKLTARIKSLYGEIEDIRTEMFILRTRKIELQCKTSLATNIATIAPKARGQKKSPKMEMFEREIIIN